MNGCQISVALRVTVRGCALEGSSLASAAALAKELREQGISLKLRVGDGLFETFARNAGQCYCHAEQLGEETELLHTLQREYPRENPDGPMRLWGVVQDRFDLVRSMCDTDGFVLFPPAGGQFAEFAYMLSQAGGRANSAPVALVGWTRGQFKLLQSCLPADSALVLRRFYARQVYDALLFLRRSEVFLARAASRETAA